MRCAPVGRTAGGMSAEPVISKPIAYTRLSSTTSTTEGPNFLVTYFHHPCFDFSFLWHLAERWRIAAREGLVIYLRGDPEYLTLPQDLLDRMLDYVMHVLPTLDMLLKKPGMSHKPMNDG
jgi:hypothetical protein